MGIAEIEFYFLLEIQASFFRHTDILRFKISKKIFFLNLDFGYHRKMYRLVPCIPILGGGVLKVQKECVYAIMLKIALVLVKNVFFGLKKGISE